MCNLSFDASVSIFLREILVGSIISPEAPPILKVENIFKMNISRALCVFFVCFWCSTLISSDQLEPNYFAVNQELIAVGSNHYQNYLEIALVAASSGKNIFKMSDSLSEDCQRTAKVMMILLAKPSTWAKTKAIQFMSMTVTVSSSIQIERNPVEVLCKNINEMMNESQSDFPNFEQLKKNVTLSNDTKNYFLEIQADQSVVKLLTEWVRKVNDTEILRYMTVRHFHNLENAELDQSDRQFAGVVRAIHQLSQRDTFKSTVDRIFNQTLDDYIKDILVKNTNNNETTVASIYTFSFTKKVNDYFSKNAVVKEAYEKIKKGSSDNVNNINKVQKSNS